MIPIFLTGLSLTFAAFCTGSILAHEAECAVAFGIAAVLTFTAAGFKAEQKRHEEEPRL